MTHFESIEEIKNIRNLMERSTRYMTLSGMASILAGIYALIGATAAYFLVYRQNFKYDTDFQPLDKYPFDPRLVIISIALIVLILAISTAVILTRRKAIKSGSSLWNRQAKRVIYQFSIPLITGGLFCMLLIWHNNIAMVASACLVFYGLAMLNASKFTFNETHQFGLSQIILGIFAGIFLKYGIIFWTLGFGICHIIFGIFIYRKYEKAEK